METKGVPVTFMGRNSVGNAVNAERQWRLDDFCHESCLIHTRRERGERRKAMETEKCQEKH